MASNTSLPSNKPYLNEKVIKALSNNIMDYKDANLFNENQEDVKAFIKHMLFEDMHFCALISGFRGTGKTTLVDYIFSELSNDMEKSGIDYDVVLVRFNTTRYSSYEHFLRKIIRELYLAVKTQCKGYKIRKSLKRLYYSTFYDVKEYFDYSSKRKNDRTYTEKNSVSVTNEFSFSEIVLALLAAVFNKSIWGKIGTIATVLIGNHTIKYFNESSKNRELALTSEQELDYKMESLYDEEIAEYKLFEELRRLYADNKRVVFVIDELDKLSDETVSKITADLKPLMLSGYCNTMFVAGINFEKEFIDEKQTMDSMSVGFFNYKYYLPLSSPKDLIEIGKLMMDSCFTINQVYEDYFIIKAVESRGIKRNFINSIISDSKVIDNKLMLPLEVIDAYVNTHQMILSYYDGLNDLILSLRSESNEEDLDIEISLQYAFYYVLYKSNHSEINDNIDSVRMGFELSINEKDRNYICKLLDKEWRNEILNTLNVIEKDANGSDETIEKEDSLSNYNQLSDEEIENVIKNNFNNILKSFQINYISLTDKERNVLFKIYRVFVLFSLYAEIDFEKFGEIIYKELIELKYPDITADSRFVSLSFQEKLILWIYGASRQSRLVVGGFIELLFSAWYHSIINNNYSLNARLYNQLSTAFRPFDIVDRDHQVAFDLRYYSSSHTYTQFSRERYEKAYNRAVPAAKDMNVSKIAFVSFIYRINSNIITDPEILNDGDITVMQIMVNMSTFVSFMEGMDRIKKYILE